MVQQVSTEKPMDDPIPEQVDQPYRNCGLCRAHVEAGSWKTVAIGGLKLKPMDMMHTGANLDSLQPMGRAHA